MNKKIFAVLGIGAVVFVAGCQYLNSKLPENPPTQREQLCSELKRNLVFNTTSITNMATSSPTQRAELMKLYDKNNCSEFEHK